MSDAPLIKAGMQAKFPLVVEKRYPYVLLAVGELYREGLFHEPLYLISLLINYQGLSLKLTRPLEW